MTVLLNYRTYDGGRQILDMHKDSEAAYSSYIGLYEHTAEDIMALFCVALHFFLKNCRPNLIREPYNKQKPRMEFGLFPLFSRAMVYFLVRFPDPIYSLNGDMKIENARYNKVNKLRGCGLGVLPTVGRLERRLSRCDPEEKHIVISGGVFLTALYFVSSCSNTLCICL